MLTLSREMPADRIDNDALAGAPLDQELKTPVQDRSPDLGRTNRSVSRLSNALVGLSRYWFLAALAIAWQIASTSVPGLSIQLPAPSDVFWAALELIKKGTLQTDVIDSLKRVGMAMLWASLVGFPLGALLGGSRYFAWSVAPVVNFLRPIPPLAWIPLSILWFGIGDLQNEFIIFLAAVFPIITNTAEGVRDVDERLVRAARTLGAKGPAVVFTVILPAALPSMFVGFRVGIGIAWMALVAGELVAATSGLGYLISQGRLLFRSDYIVVGMVMIGLIGLILDSLVRALQRTVTPWRADMR
jgi:ABC-type nitrate/sulfonate/bicarbonate transport system permease component